jgi:hypothetical protein
MIKMWVAKYFKDGKTVDLRNTFEVGGVTWTFQTFISASTDTLYCFQKYYHCNHLKI